ncbi:MAG: glycosyltransferase family 2 protein [Propionibacteriaceae bacterium]
MSTGLTQREWPAVSVVMPVLNEERHLAVAVDRVLEQGYPGELEVVLAVGPSRDRTAQIAAQIEATHPNVRVVANPAGKTPNALNVAIAAAKHDLIVRVDGHGELTPNYIARAVEILAETGAVNVGGVMDAQGETSFESAVAWAYTSRLGLGGSKFHLAESPAGPAETVFLGVFRREALRAVGGFDETMHRAQDWELNHRLIAAGGLVWFSPELRVTYRPRPSLKALIGQFYSTGQWRREVVRRLPDTASPRYLAPPVATAGIVAGTLAGLVAAVGVRHRRALGWLRIGWLAPVGYVTLVVGAAAAARDLDPAVRRWLPLVLAAMHLSWGAGFLVGLPRAHRGR